MGRNIVVRLPRLNDCEGDIEKKWFIYFSVRNPKTGKMQRFKKYESLHKVKTKQERYRVAEERKEFYAARLKAGWTPFDSDDTVIYQDQLEYNNVAAIYGRKRAANKTFRFFASRFIEGLNGMEHATLKTYTSKLRVFSQWLDVEGLAGNDISVLGQKQMFDFFNWLINSRKLSRNSVKKYRQLLIKVFELAIAEKAITASPVHSLPVCFREVDMAARPIQQFDIQTLLEVIDEHDPQLGLFIRFEYNCFMRPKEIRLMRIKWIDFAAGTITVPRDVLKTKHDRISIIPENFLKHLRKINLQVYNREFYVMGNKRVPGPITVGKNSFRFRFNKFREDLNMPLEYKLYSWKHSGNVKAEAQNIPMLDRMHQNGHRSIQTTEVYTRNRIGKSGNAFKSFDGI